MTGNSCLVDWSGCVLIRNFSSIVPEHLLQLAEKVSAQHKPALLRRAPVLDMRGNHFTARFGSYIERGGSGRIWTRKQLEGLEGFIEDISPVGEFVSNVFAQLCSEVAKQVENVPQDKKLWPVICLLFWNGTNISKVHTDPRDLTWSMVLPFGKFQGGQINLPYLNATLESKRGDLYLINSNRVFHSLCASSGDREVFVFTNHRVVVTRFNK